MIALLLRISAFVSVSSVSYMAWELLSGFFHFTKHPEKVAIYCGLALIFLIIFWVLVMSIKKIAFAITEFLFSETKSENIKTEAKISVDKASSFIQLLTAIIGCITPLIPAYKMFKSADEIIINKDIKLERTHTMEEKIQWLSTLKNDKNFSEITLDVWNRMIKNMPWDTLPKVNNLQDYLLSQHKIVLTEIAKELETARPRANFNPIVDGFTNFFNYGTTTFYNISKFAVEHPVLMGVGIFTVSVAGLYFLGFHASIIGILKGTSTALEKNTEELNRLAAQMQEQIQNQGSSIVALRDNFQEQINNQANLLNTVVSQLQNQNPADIVNLSEALGSVSHNELVLAVAETNERLDSLYFLYSQSQQTILSILTKLDEFPAQ